MYSLIHTKLCFLSITYLNNVSITTRFIQDIFLEMFYMAVSLFLTLHVIRCDFSCPITASKFDDVIKTVIFFSPQVLQEVLSLYSVPETSFAKACIIIDKVSVLLMPMCQHLNGTLDSHSQSPFLSFS